MTTQNKLTRRQLLKLGATGGLIVVGGGTLSACAPRSARTIPGTVTVRSSTFVPDIAINLTAALSTRQILPGNRTNVWAYDAQVSEGDRNSVIRLPASYLGPIIKVRTGQKMRVNFTNALPEGQPTIVHWHGLVLPEEMDGHPRYAINSGQTYVYEFEVKNRAGTYWFHPHPHGLTPLQVNNGLAGLFLVSDEEEASAGLPSGEQDIPIIIQDRTFDANNQFVYNVPSLHTIPMGNVNQNGMMAGMMSGGGMTGGTAQGLSLIHI